MEKKYVQLVVPVGDVLTAALTSIMRGEEKVKFAVYENDHHKENKQAPHFKAGNMAAWVGKYTPKTFEEQTVVDEIMEL